MKDVILRSEHRRILSDAQLRGDLRASERYKLGFANGAAFVLYAAVLALTFVAVSAFLLGMEVAGP